MRRAQMFSFPRRVVAGLRGVLGVGFLAMTSLPEVSQLSGGVAGLRNLPGVAVLAEDTARDIRPHGVTSEWLQQHVTTSLRQASVPLLQRSDALSSEEQSLLVVRLQTVAVPDSRAFAWHLSLAVHRSLIRFGPSPDTVLAQAWAATESIGVTTARHLRDSVRETLDRKLDELARAWAAAAR